jgi:hypothetical protein
VANQGGAVYGWDASPRFVGCTFRENTVTNREMFGFGLGAAMYWTGSSATPLVTNCVFSGNWATNDAGAFVANGAAAPLVTDCTFTGNRGPSGAAVYNLSGSATTFENSRFYGNVADYNGGAMLCDMGTTSVVVRGCEFATNAAERGRRGLRVGRVAAVRGVHLPREHGDEPRDVWLRPRRGHVLDRIVCHAAGDQLRLRG